jgi:hypothetical protein
MAVGRSAATAERIPGAVLLLRGHRQRHHHSASLDGGAPILGCMRRRKEGHFENALKMALCSVVSKVLAKSNF